MAMIMTSIYDKPRHQIKHYWPSQRELFSTFALAKFPMILFLIAGLCVIICGSLSRERCLEMFLVSGYLFLFSWIVPVITWPIFPGETYVTLGLLFYSVSIIALSIASSIFRRSEDKTL